MAALEEARDSVRQGPALHRFAVPVEDGYTIYSGAVVVVGADGYAKPGEEAEGLTVVGVAVPLQPMGPGITSIVGDGTSASSNLVQCETGVWLLDNDGSNPCDQGDAFQNVYLVDDHTVSSLSTGRSVAGVMVGLADNGQVKVKLGIG